MTLDRDARWMRRALQLAGRARGHTSPNPMVGAVVVQDDRAVGEGYHHRAGGPHAEVLAFRAAGEAARGGTLYVTLEPCRHHGRTPPCTEAIVAAGVARVVAAMVDPDPRVIGRGVADLRRAGIEVEVGLLEAEALMRRALRISESQVPPNPPVLAGRLRSLALFLEDDGRFLDAVSLLRRALEVSEACYGPEHPRVAPYLSDLARLLHANSDGDLTEAEHLLRRAWELDERVYPPDDPVLVADLKAMASLLKDAGRLSEAEELMCRALIIDIDRYGEDSCIVTKDVEWLKQLWHSTHKMA